MTGAATALISEGVLLPPGHVECAARMRGCVKDRVGSELGGSECACGRGGGGIGERWGLDLTGGGSEGEKLNDGEWEREGEEERERLR